MRGVLCSESSAVLMLLLLLLLCARTVQCNHRLLDLFYLTGRPDRAPLRSIAPSQARQVCGVSNHHHSRNLTSSGSLTPSLAQLLEVNARDNDQPVRGPAPARRPRCLVPVACLLLGSARSDGSQGFFEGCGAHQRPCPHLAGFDYGPAIGPPSLLARAPTPRSASTHRPQALASSGTGTSSWVLSPAPNKVSSVISLHCVPLLAPPEWGGTGPCLPPCHVPVTSTPRPSSPPKDTLTCPSDPSATKSCLGLVLLPPD